MQCGDGESVCNVKPIPNLRKAAQNQSCVMCGYDEEGAVVLAHLPHRNSGMGMKCPDIVGAHLCSRCHDFIDGRAKVDGLGLSHDEDEGLFEWRYLVLTRTLERLWKDGTVRA